jgi:hypothetical protein
VRFGHLTPRHSFATSTLLGGATMTLLYEPDGSAKTTVRVIGARHVEPRSVRIKKASG